MPRSFILLAAVVAGFAFIMAIRAANKKNMRK